MSDKDKCNKDGCHTGELEPVRSSMRPDLLEEIEGWEISEGVLVREFTFENFLRALEFVNKVGVLAEEMNHHPDIWLAWGKVKVAVWTHAINDLTIVDFVVARAINQICEDSE